MGFSASNWFTTLLGIAGLVAWLASTSAALAHVIMLKRDGRAAVAWAGLIVFSPFVGAFLYWCLGINRIQRRTRRLLGTADRSCPVTYPIAGGTFLNGHPFFLQYPHLAGLSQLVERLAGRPLEAGNTVQPLICGDEAYPVMLDDIEHAKRSITLCSYIFESDEAGRPFIDALIRAAQRGVAVRVLIDDVGARYGKPNSIHVLAKAGVPTAGFLPTRVPRLFHYANLRNHRKILIVDGAVGFTGGMNIRAGNLLALRPRQPIQDIHFRVAGPLVAQLQETFAFDWQFTTGESLTGETWFRPLTKCGDVLARGISGGPDEDFERLRLALLGAIAAARRQIFIMSPYFLPEAALILALNVASLRGVAVNVVMPESNNLPYVHAASRALWWQLLERGCRIWLSPPPFDHTKLTVVDEAWTLFGSSNWDPRSLRLNFEFDVECYGETLGRQLTTRIRQTLARSKEITQPQMDARSIPTRLLDGTFRLFAPYL